MLILTFQVNNDPGHIQGIKEELAMLLEKWGDVQLIDVHKDQRTALKQMRIGEPDSVQNPKRLGFWSFTNVKTKECE